MKRFKLGKFLGQMMITALLGAVIMSLVSGTIGLITPLAGVFASFLIAVISVVFFGFAMRINPGKEEFLTTLPIVILSIAVIDLTRMIVPIIPVLAIPFTFIGFAFGLGSVFLATMITKRYIIKGSASRERRCY